MSSIRSILVLGAGELGQAILWALSKHTSALKPSPSITVLLRATSNSDGLNGLGLSIIRHDIAALSIPELAEVLAAYDAVITCTGFAAGPGTQTKITQAALLGGVKRIIPWQFGVDYEAIGKGSGQDLWDEQLDVRAVLRSQSGEKHTDWVIVSTGIFTSFVFEDSFGVVEGAISGALKPESPIAVRALGSWDNELSVTTVEDIGDLTARILLDPEVRNQVVFVAGDTISYDRIARVVEKVSRREVKKELWDSDFLDREVQENPTTMSKYRAAFGKGKGLAWKKEQTYNAKLGVATADVETWLRQRLDQVTM